MNWDYISGFFDADGSITLSTYHKGANKTIQISFHNNELNILNEIRSFIEKETGIKGVITTKQPAKEAHQIAYDLKYVYFRTANRVLEHINSIHPKKQHRIKISFELEKLTPRNGKYSQLQAEQKSALEKLFFEH